MTTIVVLQVNRELAAVPVDNPEKAASRGALLKTFVAEAVQHLRFGDHLAKAVEYSKLFLHFAKHYMPLYGDRPTEDDLRTWRMFHQENDATNGPPTDNLVRKWESTVGLGYVRADHKLPPAPSPAPAPAASSAAAAMMTAPRYDLSCLL